MKIDIYFDDADAAVAHCHQMISDGTANLFRGQTNDWPTIAPSLFRGSDDIRTAAQAVLNDFSEWASIVPQMAAYHENREQITAIA